MLQYTLSKKQNKKKLLKNTYFFMCSSICTLDLYVCLFKKVFLGCWWWRGGRIRKSHNGGQWNGNTTQARPKARKKGEYWRSGEKERLEHFSKHLLMHEHCNMLCQLHLRWIKLTVIVCPMWTTGGGIHLHFCINAAIEHLNNPGAFWKSILRTEECKMQISLCLTNSWDDFVSLKKNKNVKG